MLARQLCVVFLAICTAASVMGQQPDPQATPDSQTPPDAQPDAVPAITSFPTVPPAIRDAMQSRDFESAIAAIDAALGNDDSASDYLLYLKGLAQTESDQLDAAIATFEKIENEFPESQWRSRAKFGRAGVLVKRRQYIGAGEIYREEAERLLSRGRKDELAGIYLEFADRYYDGVPAKDPSKAKQPDFQQALTYYQEAVKLKPTNELLQRLEFRIARCLEETDQHEQAIESYRSYLQRFGGDEPSTGLSASPVLLAEATFRLGSVQLSAGRSAAARRTWQDLLRSDIGQSDDKEVIEFLAKAEHRIAHTYGLPTPASVGDLELGTAAAGRFLENHPGHELAPKAELEIAQSLIHHGRFEAAVEQLASLIENPDYQESDRLPEARRMLGQAFLSSQQFDAAIKAWNEFLDRHPTDPQWPGVQKWIVDAEYAKASYLQGQKQYDEARQVWQTFLNKYPLDPRAPSILYQFGQMKYGDSVQRHIDRVKAAMERGDSPQSIEVSDECEKLFLEAIADWRRLATKYPATSEASQASFMIGVTLEDRLGQLPEALDAYKSVTGNYQSKAQQRISRLTTPQLELVTERKFRSDEKPRIKLTTRNLEKVTVKAYRVDMTDYFRKMHLASGIETLDIALIDPDSQFEYTVNNYSQYQRVDNDVEIPVDGVGVTAVTVTSEKLEGTTMLVVSDLDVIVKASRNELFVFAEDMLHGKPVEGASVLISNGSDVFGEELTNHDGVLRKSFKELKDVSDLRVFAVHQGNVASTVNNLNGLDFAVGLAPRGYLYTDRPAYRAGQLVNIKGIVRWVDQDQFTFEPGEKFTLDVFDARGRQLKSTEVALNGYGTIQGNLVLPDTAPQGEYRVHLHRASTGSEDATGTLSFSTTFNVTQYRLEPIQIEIDLDQNVYFRGDKVKGTITAKYYYGTPLAGESLTYTFGPDGETISATTDDEGKIEVEFETQRFSESQPLALNVQYPSRGLSANETVFLATRGFAVGVQSKRSVYIGGETFDTTFKVTDPAGDPVDTQLKIEVFEQTNVSGEIGEKLVQSHDVETDADSGEVTHTLSIDDGGMYLVRATGVDQFGNQVSGQKRLRISGDKDNVRLRILADKHSYWVGETAQVRVHWRQAPALALVTHEGANVLGYELVQLKTGDNVIDVPMTSQLAPNFVFSIAVMEGNRYHAAASGFDVSQKLNVTLKPRVDSLEPGQDLIVDLLVTDPQGNPVQSELSLALVQTNLLSMFGDVQGTVDAFFGAGRRKPSVRQMTSCTFTYRPATQQVSQFLLAEAERRERLEREVRALADVREGFIDELFARGGDMPADAVVGLDVSGDSNAIYLQQQVIAGRGGAGGGIQNWAMNNSFDVNGVEFFADGNLHANLGAMADGDVDGITADDITVLFGSNMPAQQGGFAYGGLSGGGMGGGGAGGFGGQNRGVAPQRQSRRSLQQMDGSFENDFAIDLAPQLNFRAGANQALLEQSNQQQLPSLHRWGAEAYYKQLAAPGSSVGGPGPGWIQQIPANWNDQFQQRDVTINALTAEGKFLAINGRDAEQVQGLAGDVGFRLMPGMAHAETAFWDPVIVTDEEGKAEVVITMPTRSTAWRLRAKAINAEALGGEASADVITKKDLFGDLKLPLAFTHGDQAEVPVEIHHSLEGKQNLKAVLTLRMGDKSTSQTREISAAAAGIHKLSFPIELDAADAAEFTLTVSAGDEHSDTVTQQVPVKPYGFPVYQTASGTSSQNTIALIEFDEDTNAQDPSLEILIGANVNRSLVEGVLGGGLFPVDRCGLIPSGGLERSVSDVLGGVALMQMIRGAQQSGTPEAQALASRINSAVTQLISSQRDDGGWSNSGQPDRGEVDAYLTARIMWALSAARSAGYAVSDERFELGKAFLKNTFAATSQSELERQTILLQAMAESGCADFALANRLYRERNRLSASGLLHLALALAAMNHDEMGEQLLELVEISADIKTAGNGTASRVAGVVPWMNSGTELRALYLLALEKLDPANPKSAQLADWLMAARVGSRWPVEKSNGLAVSALAGWFAKTQHLSEKYKLTIWVNDNEVDAFTVDPAKDGSRRLVVPNEFLEPGKRQRIHLDMQGRGTFSYSAILSGFVPAEQLTKTTDDWYVSRRYEPAQKMIDGRVVPRGFGIVDGSYSSFVNPLTQLAVGNRGEVTLSPRRRSTNARGADQYDYLVMTDSIPAGCTILEDSVQGNFERFEIEPGRITFYLGAQRYPGDIRYTLVGYVPGEYRAAQTLLRSFYDPSQLAIADVKTLTVLPSGEESVDEYRLTPEELYDIGRRELEKGDFAAAHKHLSELLDQWRLREEPFRKTVEWLFRTSLEQDLHGEIVKYFEIIKEKYPSIELAFADILQVAQSYRELGEYERSYLVYRSTVEASFERESQVAGFLNGRGEFLRSVAAMERLLRDYPAEGYVATATYALAQEVYRRAPIAHEDARLKEQHVNRVHLIHGSIDMLDHFVTAWPMDPAADQASFALATALIDLDQYESAIKHCERYSETYSESRLLDSFWYMIGYSHFELENHEQALEMCRRVASAAFPVAETGGVREADNKWEAVYIMGQVYHSLGQAADAILQYTKVQQRFADASEAIDFFTRKEIHLEEVTTIKPDDAKELVLDHRNVAEVAIKVYRIDLMKFGLMQRNLDRITAINLAGIKPYHEEIIGLGDGKDYRDRETKLRLPLKEEGAYLVVCRGDNLYASGLVLVSPLTLSVREDEMSGRVRVSVKNSSTDRFVDDVHVKVIGSANEDFQSGQTDLRGLFVADDIQGTSTVIAQVDDNKYAFYRGKLAMQGVLSMPNAAAQDEAQASQAPSKSKGGKQTGKDALRGNIFNTNGVFQREQQDNYDGLLNNDREGIAPSEAY